MRLLIGCILVLIPNVVGAFDLEEWIKKYENNSTGKITVSEEEVEEVEESGTAGSMSMQGKYGTKLIAPFGSSFVFHEQRHHGNTKNATNYPKMLSSRADGLFSNFIEVFSDLHPHSPLAKKLALGDLVYSINGVKLRDDLEHRLVDRENIRKQGTHGLRPHLAELLDEGLAKGQLDLEFLRFPKKVESKFVREKNSKEHTALEVDPNKGIKVFINLKGSNTLKIKLPQTRKEGKKSSPPAFFHFMQPRFITKDGKKINLSTAIPKRVYPTSSGKPSKIRGGRPLYKGSVTFGGKNTRDFFAILPESELDFDVPENVVGFEAFVQMIPTPKLANKADPAFLKANRRFYKIELSAWETNEVEKAKLAWKEMETVKETKTLSIPLGKNSRLLRLATHVKSDNESPLLANPIDISGLRLVDKSRGITLKPDELSIAWVSIKEQGVVYKSRNEVYGLQNGVWGLFYAPHHLVISIPRGDWKLEGEVKWGVKGLKSSWQNNQYKKAKRVTCEKLVISVAPEVTFPSSWKKYAHKETIILPKVGSFAGKFDPKSPTFQNYNDLICYSLLKNQLPDGHWPVKRGNYVSPTFATSFSGLGLLATGEEKYSEAIKKAAHYVARNGGKEVWTYSAAVEIIFLSEYYLRTKDETILPRLQQMVKDVEKFVTPDFYAGHKIFPGYYGSGWVGPGGPLSLAWAIASHTPAGKDPVIQYKLDKMLEAISQAAPNGRMPYGRSGTGRPELSSDAIEPGQSASIGDGAYYLASRIRGGTEPFRSAAKKRFSDYPFGDCYLAHAAGPLSTLWSYSAAASIGQDAYAKQFKLTNWLFIMGLHYSGYVGQNILEAETGNAAGVSMGKPYTQIGIQLISLNAFRQNLAFTGKKEYQTAKAKPYDFVYAFDDDVQQTYMRSWAIVDTILGKDSPPIIKEALKEITSLKPSLNYGLESAIIYKKYRELIAKALPLDKLDPNAAYQCLLHAYGYDVHLKTILDHSKADGKPGWTLETEFAINKRLHRCRSAFQNRYDEFLPKMKGTFTFITPNGEKTSAMVQGKKGFQEHFIPKMKDPEGYVAQCKIRFEGTIEGKAFRCEYPALRPKSIKKTTAYANRNNPALLVPNITFNGVIGQWDVKATLPNGYGIDLAFKNGAFDRKTYLSIDGQERVTATKTGLIPAGLVGSAHLTLNGMNEYVMVLIETSRKTLDDFCIKPDRVIINGRPVTAKEISNLNDYNTATNSGKATGGKAIEVIYEYDQPLPTEVIFIATTGKRSQVQIETKKNGKWQSIDQADVAQKTFGKIFESPEIKGSKSLRFTINPDNGKAVLPSEIRVHHNRRVLKK